MAKTKDKKLKPAEQLFCNLYAGSSEYFNNATMSYVVAFKYPLPDKPEGKRPGRWDKKISPAWKEYLRREHIAASFASRLLTNDKIRQKCQEVLLAHLDNDHVDAELSYTIKQRKDLNSKMRGVDIYNKLKGRITEKVEHSGGVIMEWQK